MPEPKYNRGATASTFDLMHAGHVLMLKEAREICKHLTVCLQRDITDEDMYYRLAEKGQQKNSPIMSLGERRILLEGSKYVDEIVEYNTEEELYNIMKNGNFDVRIIGKDWKGRKYTGYDLPIPMYFNSRDHEYSTSALREKVYQAHLAKLQENRRTSDL
jgi:glycerol-3-phosphate cytidylyltransferase